MSAPTAEGSSSDLVLEIRNGPTSARICRYGASVMSLLVPDSSGAVRDVVLGFENPLDYLEKNSPYFGCVVGRVANRIAGAQFTLNDVTYKLPANHGPNTLHGGPEGVHKHLWTVEEGSRTESSVTLRTLSADGDQGFPGDVEVSVKYSLPSPTQLIIEMTAKALTKRTPISLAHHMYWNLGGHDQGTILDHELLLNSTSYTPVDDGLIPTGEILKTAGTPYDFSRSTVIGARIEAVPGGYDHNYVVNSEPAPSSVADVDLSHVATVRSPESGFLLTLHSNAPGVQFYSGNFLDSSLAGKGGVQYQKHSGLCLETQGFPNAVNEPKFPSVVREVGEVYKHIMLVSFRSP